ncbi:hypothetical protein [Formosa algae]|uniref:hypothetical protein n=1 Tax=Formosa algae TaxID=225843 RepID=UPI000CCE0B77|nr:hypothetical protein [Formosa algae]PNW28737.1 hypothetical protein BKP44_07430 [Formosa algae]
MKYSVSITYKDLFDDYSTVDVNALLADIPTKNSVQLIGYFLAQIHLEKLDEKLQVELIEFWSQRLPADLKSRIQEFTIQTVKDKKTEFTFISNLSGLIFMETILENYNELEPLDDLTPEQELNFFKAYLISTQTWIDKQGKILFDIKPFENDMDFVKTFLPSHIAIDEFHTVKDFRTQFIKAKHFFQFCETDEEFKVYLDIFLKEYGLDSWATYLKNILSLYIRKFERLKTPSVIIIESEHQEQINFLAQLSIEIEGFSKSDDFLQLREKPIYRLNETDFVFLNLNFFVDKIYQGIQFDFARVLVDNSATFKGKKIKTRVQFLSIFGDEFSETGLFYNIMQECFEKSKYNIFNGNQIKEIITDGEPDYYIRDKAKIYLFEFKNVFLGGKIKHALDYEKIKGGIYEKLVENKSGSPKGIKQLTAVIEKIREKEFNKFDDYNFDETIIYPVIVFTDYSFNTAGVNYMLNEEFREFLESQSVELRTKIKNLIIIDLDDFIKYQDLFRDKKIKLNNLFNGYLEFIKGYRKLPNKFTPYQIYIENRTNKIKSNLSRNTIDEIATLLGIPK